MNPEDDVMRAEQPIFIGWPNEGVEYWNAYWRHQERRGFFDDIRIE